MLYKKQSNIPSYTTIYSLNSTQTLTTLMLHENRIGAQGAQYLANALQQNTVIRLNTFLFVIRFQ